MRILTTIICILFLTTDCFSQANAGADQTVWMPNNTVTLSGSGGSTYQWTYISGKQHATNTFEGKITSPTSATTTITDLTVGIYKYELSVNGGTSKDTVQITIYNQKSPSCYSGTNKSITLGITTPGANKEAYHPNVGTEYGLNPGDTIHIQAGNYQLIQFGSPTTGGGMSGDSCRRIEVVLDGIVTCTYTGQAPMIRFYNCRYFNLHGAGKLTIQAVRGQDAKGLSVNKMSSDYTIDSIHFISTGNAVISKNDPDTTQAFTYAPNWNFGNAVYSHFQIDTSDGEGMYIGNTFSPAVLGYQPTRYKKCVFDHITAKYTGWDGLQYSNGDSLIMTYDTVIISGTANLSSQMYGIVDGGFVSYSLIQNCYVYGSKSSAVGVFGNDSAIIINNKFDSCAKGSVDGVFATIFINDNHVTGLPNPTPQLKVRIENNCILNVSSYTAGAAIRNANGNSTTSPGYIRYNTIYDPLGRTLSNLIYDDSVGDTINGNVLSATCPTNTTTRKGIWF